MSNKKYISQVHLFFTGDDPTLHALNQIRDATGLSPANATRLAIYQASQLAQQGQMLGLPTSTPSFRHVGRPRKENKKETETSKAQYICESVGGTVTANGGCKWFKYVEHRDGSVDKLEQTTPLPFCLSEDFPRLALGSFANAKEAEKAYKTQKENIENKPTHAEKIAQFRASRS